MGRLCRSIFGTCVIIMRSLLASYWHHKVNAVDRYDYVSPHEYVSPPHEDYLPIWTSPPYAIPYGWWIPNPIYGYRYWVGIVRLMPVVMDMRSEIGDSGSEEKSFTLLRSKSQNDPISIFHAPKSPLARSSGPSHHRSHIECIGLSDPYMGEQCTLGLVTICILGRQLTQPSREAL